MVIMMFINLTETLHQIVKRGDELRINKLLIQLVYKLSSHASCKKVCKIP